MPNKSAFGFVKNNLLATLQFILIVGIVVPSAFAQSGGSAATQVSAAEVLKNLRSARGEFEQIIREQDGYVVDRQTGTFALQKPKMLRWEVSELDQTLISDGKQLFLYDRLFEQVVVRDWSSDPIQNPAAILLDDINLEDWAVVESSGQSVKLTPIGSMPSIREIKIDFDGRFPKLLSLLDTTGQITEIRFFKVEIDTALSESLFQFDIPAGVEVIYEN